MSFGFFFHFCCFLSVRFVRMIYKDEVEKKSQNATNDHLFFIDCQYALHRKNVFVFVCMSAVSSCATKVALITGEFPCISMKHKERRKERKGNEKKIGVFSQRAWLLICVHVTHVSGTIFAFVFCLVIPFMLGRFGYGRFM